MIEIVYIMGADRSGSTTLERLLGAHDNTIVVGEIGRTSIWENGFEEERLCSCRAPIKDCPFWSDVRRRAFGPRRKPDEAAVDALIRSVNRIRYVPMMRYGTLRSRGFAAGLPVSVALLENLYAGIAEASNGRTVVDSTKNPSYAHLLSLSPRLRVAYVHLVRDSRAVAHSHSRSLVKPDVHWTRETVNPKSPSKSARLWNLRYAASLALLPYVRPAVLQLRYEDFAADPAHTGERIARHLDRLGMRPLGPRRADAESARYHSVYGNPMRFAQNFNIRSDEEWRTAMPAKTKAFVGALTLPFLVLHRLGIGFRRYGVAG